LAVGRHRSLRGSGVEVVIMRGLLLGLAHLNNVSMSSFNSMFEATKGPERSPSIDFRDAVMKMIPSKEEYL
jgi:hypothetical protein